MAAIDAQPATALPTRVLARLKLVDPLGPIFDASHDVFAIDVAVGDFLQDVRHLRLQSARTRCCAVRLNGVPNGINNATR